MMTPKNERTVQQPARKLAQQSAQFNSPMAGDTTGLILRTIAARLLMLMSAREDGYGSTSTVTGDVQRGQRMIPGHVLKVHAFIRS